jgi:ATP-dependent Zn protease
VTFVPYQRPNSGRFSPTVRTVLFWVLMIALAVVLWQMASRKSVPVAPQMNYSDFMTQVDKGNISEAHLYESPSTAGVRGQLREPPGAFQTAIPKETIPDVMDRLRKQGATVEVSETRGYNWKDEALDWALPVLLIGLWLFLMSRRGRGRLMAPPTDAANRPIG